MRPQRRQQSRGRRFNGASSLHQIKLKCQANQKSNVVDRRIENVNDGIGRKGQAREAKSRKEKEASSPQLIPINEIEEKEKEKESENGNESDSNWENNKSKGKCKSKTKSNVAKGKGKGKSKKEKKRKSESENEDSDIDVAGMGMGMGMGLQLEKDNNNNNKENKNDNNTMVNENDENDNDEHLNANHYLNKKRTKTSSNTLESINFLTEDEMIGMKSQVLSKISNFDKKEMLFEKEYKKHYLEWFIELHSNFNLLFYGVGSKKQLLDEYCYKYLIDGPLIIVNGYFPQMNIKIILNKMYDKVCQSMNASHKYAASVSSSLSNSNAKSQPILLAQTIVNLLNSDKRNDCDNNNDDNNNNGNDNDGKMRRTRIRRQTRHYGSDRDRDGNKGSKWNHFYLLIHNIDGIPLRNYISQKCLSILADCSKIHLIASVDHIHSLFLWDHSMLCKYHWVYHELTTYMHYDKECIDSFDNPIISSMNNVEIKARGIKHVLKSLTPNHCDLLDIVANAQIENMENGNFNSNTNAKDIGLSYKQWYDEAQSSMLVNSDLQFRKYLTELTDHAIIVEQRNFYKIPYSADIIRTQILQL